MVVAFDLDDTLFPEADYVESAFRAIGRRYGLHLLGPMMCAATPAEAFDSTGLPVDDLLAIYRTHFPDIRLPWESLYALASLRNAGHRLALVTDGRSVTQRHKIEALGLGRFIAPDMMFISAEVGEGKAGGRAFLTIMERCPGETFMYVGDNPDKDVAAPLALGWKVVLLRSRGRNIHPQNLSRCGGAVCVDSLTELMSIAGAAHSPVISR